MSFVRLEQSTQNVIVDSSQMNLYTDFNDGGRPIQLKQLQQSGFDWSSKDIKEITIDKDFLVYDADDISFLADLILKQVKLNFSGVFISPDVIDGVCETFDVLRQYVSVAEGSRISIPSLGGYSGMDRSFRIKMACQRIGFNRP